MSEPPGAGLPADACAIVDGWSSVEAVGPDAGSFLQSFCTNDVLKLADGDACEAMFTDVKAHVLAYGWVGRVSAERLLVLLWSDRAEALREHLDRYLIREQVELAARQDLRVALAGDATDDASASSFRCEAFGPAARVLVRDDAEHLAVANHRTIESEEFERLRIRLGVPRDGVDVDDRNLPQEVDRNERAISFTKGCYLGQEPVARIDALGRVNWLLRGLEIDGTPPEPSAELMRDGKAVGRVTSSVANDRGAIALAYLRREHAEAGTELAVEGSAAKVCAFPMSV